MIIASEALVLSDEHYNDKWVEAMKNLPSISEHITKEARKGWRGCSVPMACKWCARSGIWLLKVWDGRGSDDYVRLSDLSGYLVSIGYSVSYNDKKPHELVTRTQKEIRISWGES